MKLAGFPNVQALPRDKLQLVEEIWFSMGEDLEQLPVSNEEKDLLNARWTDYARDPSTALTLEQLKAKMDARRRE